MSAHPANNKTVAPARSAAIVSPMSVDRAATRSFLSDVVIDFGPEEVLGRLFLKADTALRQRGIRLRFATLEELVAINRANADNWRPLLPVFNPEFSNIAPQDGFAVVGMNAAGEAVTAHAFRYIQLGDSTLKDELESLRIFYADPDAMREPEESIAVSVPSAATRSGPVVFSGGAWYRPDYRKAGLMTFIQPAVRGLQLTRWGADYVFSFMAPELIRGGVAAKARFRHVEWEVTMVKTPVYRDGTIHAALVSTTADEQLEHFAEFMALDEDTIATASETGGGAQPKTAAR